MILESKIIPSGIKKHKQTQRESSVTHFPVEDETVLSTMTCTFKAQRGDFFCGFTQKKRLRSFAVKNLCFGVVQHSCLKRKSSKRFYTLKLKLTLSLPLKINVWKTTFPLGWPIFRVHVSFREVIFSGLSRNPQFVLSFQVSSYYTFRDDKVSIPNKEIATM